MGAVTLIRPLPAGGHCSLQDIDDSRNAILSLLHVHLSKKFPAAGPSKSCSCRWCHPTQTPENIRPLVFLAHTSAMHQDCTAARDVRHEDYCY